MRSELKYFIDYDQYLYFKSAFQQYMQPDPLMSEPDGSWVHSLYFDDIVNSNFHGKMDGVDDRFKIRAREYAHPHNNNFDPSRNVFLEKKYRHGTTISKDRQKLQKNDIIHWESFLYQCFEQNSYNQNITSSWLSYPYKPTVSILYKRYALLNKDSSFRVTFDQDLQFGLPSLWLKSEGQCYNYFFDCRVVMEIKSNFQLPTWAHQILSLRKCQVEAISKYSIGLYKLNETLGT